MNSQQSREVGKFSPKGRAASAIAMQSFAVKVSNSGKYNSILSEWKVFGK